MRARWLAFAALFALASEDVTAKTYLVPEDVPTLTAACDVAVVLSELLPFTLQKIVPMPPQRWFMKYISEAACTPEPSVRAHT